MLQRSAGSVSIGFRGTLSFDRTLLEIKGMPAFLTFMVTVSHDWPGLGVLRP